jgi:hypothetical protein
MKKVMKPVKPAAKVAKSGKPVAKAFGKPKKK